MKIFKYLCLIMQMETGVLYDKKVLFKKKVIYYKTIKRLAMIYGFECQAINEKGDIKIKLLNDGYTL